MESGKYGNQIMTTVPDYFADKLSPSDLVGLAEASDLECKAAQGRDGSGELPTDFWKSYAAMANTDGGVILLGIQEKPLGVFNALGIKDIEKVKKAIWDNLHNRQQVSHNLLSEQDVQLIFVDDLPVIRVVVPRAPRQLKPIFIGSNPINGTFLRRYEGDYQADSETVKRMLAEQIEDSRDDKILKGFDFSDLDMETVAAYRNRFSAVRPGHVWADLPTAEFLEKIGAWGKNREEGSEGLRLAGLLMFGRGEVIIDALPHYMVDYQERPEAKTEKRWVDRLVPDGSWSGNVYDFFRRVYQKITADLKVPFQLHDGQRVEDTPVHEALREALANTLIHADFTGRVSVLVVKRPDMFGFRNPGLMRIPPELAIHGGNSDCRNRRLQTMFQLVGYGDHAGSGIPKIYNNWANRHWRRPVLYELREPEQTLMELRMSSLVPEEAVAAIEAALGQSFHALSELERLILITAWSESIVSHSRLREICTDHPADISKVLAHLVRDGYLVSDGIGRGMVYLLPWKKQQEDALFDHRTGALPQQRELIPPELKSIPPELTTEPPVHLPQYLEWDQLAQEIQEQLLLIAQPVSSIPRATPLILEQTILNLCHQRYLSRRVLAYALSRNPDDLLKRTLNPMVEKGLLKTAFTSPKDPRQSYIAVNN